MQQIHDDKLGGLVFNDDRPEIFLSEFTTFKTRFKLIIVLLDLLRVWSNFTTNFFYITTHPNR